MKGQLFLNAAHKKELIEAYHVLFGTDAEVSLNSLTAINPSNLKAAYRQMAFQTHPDRAMALGLDQTTLSKHFNEVSLAYEKLKLFVIKTRYHFNINGKTYQRSPVSIRPQRKDPAAVLSDHFYKGTLPKRTLVLGQFLYYSSFISWRQLINAITWQRQHRPLIGQIARESGMLSAREISQILQKKDLAEKFGEYAVRKGYLIPFRLLVLLGKQRRFRVPIGSYFLQKGIFRSGTMDRFVENQRAHNRMAFLGKWS